MIEYKDMPFQKGNTHGSKNKGRKGQIAWNKGRIETRLSVLEKLSKSHQGKILSLEQKIKMGVFLTGEKAKHWLGDKVGYSGVHIWIRKTLGPASNYECKCGKQAKHWSNKDHSYKRKKSDYTARCVSCHRKYDYANGINKKRK